MPTMPAKQKLTIELSQPVYKLLTAAAARRTGNMSSHGESGKQPMTAEVLCMQLIAGILTRGSIDRALSHYGEYATDIRALGYARATAMDQNVRSPEAAFGSEV